MSSTRGSNGGTDRVFQLEGCVFPKHFERVKDPTSCRRGRFGFLDPGSWCFSCGWFVAACSQEGSEIQSPRRKVIRVESEETQDQVRETLNLSRDEAEEISFVPSAISITQRPMFLV